MLMNRRLYRSRTDSVIGGVAGGVAEYLDVDPSIVRIVWAVLAIITGGIFFVLYIVMWIVVPEGVSGPRMPYQPGPGAMPGWTPPVGTAGPTGTAATGPEGSDAAAMPAAEGSDPGAAAPVAPVAGDEGTPGWSTAYPAAGTGYGAAHPRRRGNGAMIFGLLLVLLGVWFLIDQYVPGIDSDLLWPVALVILGAALLFVSMRRSAEK
jgi:phage shock protein PspC (stress-responsive transcriptional regulator)